MRILPTQQRSLADALNLGPTLLRADAALALAVSVVTGPAVVLGAMQRAGRVVDLAACASAHVPVMRRATTGTGAWMGGTGLVLTLVLPHVAAIAEDATFRTLLNRNVRPLLRAFTRTGVTANYFGREWISNKLGPIALLGFDVTREGAVLIEAFVGGSEPIAIPDELVAPDERALDRFMGKPPTCLHAVLPNFQCSDFAQRLVAAVANQVDDAGASHVWEEELVGQNGVHTSREVTCDDDPLPFGFSPRTLERVPIGYIETAVSSDEPAKRWLGGDVLAPRWLYEDLARNPHVELPGAIAIDGAKLEDLTRALGNV